MPLSKSQFPDSPSAAFSLVETILAIAVIALIIVAAAQLTQSSLRVGRDTMNKFIAYHLAEEGLEIVRNLRDGNWLQNKTWRTNLNDGFYEIHENESALAGAPWKLQKLSDENSASELILSETEHFKRVIKIETIEKTMKVKSKVIYNLSGKEKTAVLSAEFTDWKKGPL